MRRSEPPRLKKETGAGEQKQAWMSSPHLQSANARAKAAAQKVRKIPLYPERKATVITERKEIPEEGSEKLIVSPLSSPFPTPSAPPVEALSARRRTLPSILHPEVDEYDCVPERADRVDTTPKPDEIPNLHQSPKMPLSACMKIMLWAKRTAKNPLSYEEPPFEPSHPLTIHPSKESMDSDLLPVIMALSEHSHDEKNTDEASSSLDRISPPHDLTRLGATHGIKK